MSSLNPVPCNIFQITWEMGWSIFPIYIPLSPQFRGPPNAVSHLVMGGARCNNLSGELFQYAPDHWTLNFISVVNLDFCVLPLTLLHTYALTEHPGYFSLLVGSVNMLPSILWINTVSKWAKVFWLYIVTCPLWDQTWANILCITWLLNWPKPNRNDDDVLVYQYQLWLCI